MPEELFTDEEWMVTLMKRTFMNGFNLSIYDVKSREKLQKEIEKYSYLWEHHSDEKKQKDIFQNKMEKYTKKSVLARLFTKKPVIGKE